MTVIRVYIENPDDLIPISELDVHPDLLRIFEEFGVIELQGDTVDVSNRKRLYRLLRLRNLLGVNLAGAAIILDLLDQIDSLESEVYRLKHQRQ